VFSLGAGICVGFAVGTKFTGLTSALLVAVILLAPLGRRAGDNPADARLGQVARLCGWAALGAAITYLGGWALHFSLLDRPGPGDIWGVPAGKLAQDIVNIHLTMLKANYGLGATHPNGSPWWAWPWMWRPIYYYASLGSAIYLLGNPVVWWGTSLGMLCVLWTSVREVLGQGPAAGLPTRQPMIRLLPLLGFLVSYLPYLVIPRVMFLYHYLPSLVFAICAVALWLDQRGWTRPGRFADQPRALRWLIILIPLGFLLVSPLSYGLGLPEELLGWLARLVHR
jgi:dolichyl-phosphate-mannose--protein O-mannosyl transferase